MEVHFKHFLCNNNNNTSFIRSDIWSVGCILYELCTQQLAVSYPEMCMSSKMNEIQKSDNNGNKTAEKSTATPAAL